MKIRFYIDPETGEPHIYEHGVDEDEVHDVLQKPIEDRQAQDGARAAVGQTRDGRYLRVIYKHDLEPDSLFVITAYDLHGKPLKALKRRRRKKS
ncbi:DUF4258 domain-containing protein [bacterium]|nr:DUF4258 domain-containing protein [bacterium]